MKKKKKKSDIIITIIIIAVAILFVVTLGRKVWELFHHDGNKTTQESVKMEEVDKLMNKNLDQRYPETPGAVAKLYCSITKELHSKDVTDEQINKLYNQMRKLFDDELLANNKYETQLEKLNKEIENYKKNKITISRYIVEDSDDIKIYTDEDGQDCTKVRITYSIKKKSEWLKSSELVILRKDEDGRWKILGNEKADTVVSDEDEE